MSEFRLLSYNIHKGFSVGNREFLLGTIRDAIRTTHADIACLQEVVGDHHKYQQHYPGWHPGGQFEFLADSVWHHYSYGKNAIYQHGHHGNAILSKFPFQQQQNVNITRWRFSQRGILHGIVAGRLHILCVHFGFLPFEQGFQLDRLIAMVKEQIPANHGLIIAGDFNDWHFRIHQKLCRQLGMQEASCQPHTDTLRKRPQATYPASRPRLSMDRIYYRNLTLKSCEVLYNPHWQSLSDHCPIMADFHFNHPLDNTDLTPYNADLTPYDTDLTP